MAYDEGLAERIRGLISTVLTSSEVVTEQRMFGGLGFLVGGNMAVAASNQGGILVRVDPEEQDDLIASTSAGPMIMGGRSVSGWLHVSGTDVDSDADLAPWVKRGVVHAASLPRKP